MGATRTARYLAATPPSEVPIAEWVEQFHRDGYLFLRSVLPPERATGGTNCWLRCLPAATLCCALR